MREVRGGERAVPEDLRQAGQHDADDAEGEDARLRGPHEEGDAEHQGEGRLAARDHRVRAEGREGGQARHEDADLLQAAQEPGHHQPVRGQPDRPEQRQPPERPQLLPGRLRRVHGAEAQVDNSEGRARRQQAHVLVRAGGGPAGGDGALEDRVLQEGGVHRARGAGVQPRSGRGAEGDRGVFGEERLPVVIRLKLEWSFCCGKCVIMLNNATRSLFNQDTALFL